MAPHFYYRGLGHAAAAAPAFSLAAAAVIAALAITMLIAFRLMRPSPGH